ncbi:alpha/beta hydrolase [Cryobacterium sp. TMT1-21]|uniref:Alpha/beta hydrolase n=1 Tax=Cryobacterium shii TaxID=1259235 RepID=A0AAQ2C9P0_9MICO|nr:MULTISPECIES: alpha/beta hydrolase [Cryobacterium]TFC53305.1 alpha/beta hydrolase [Cryobacterium shii]TFD08700.1 alpha/beta hydrolase [Cryobacterium sp. TMT1-21]TFD18490.1 alpha/beta hydrolase [Cryobacterium sp. TMT4-10]TFD40528.1 alpha/beta hydrolase [Cryobacterium sp. TMT2-10]
MTPATPVLFVHGIRTSATMWRRQLSALGETGHPALAIDLPGHGSRIDEPFTVAGALTAIDQGVEALGGRVLLVGLSLGGYYAIEYAARHPQKVIGLVAAGSCAIPAGWPLDAYRSLARLVRRLPDHGLWLHTALVRALLPRDGAADTLAGGVPLNVMDAGLGATGTLRPLDSLSRYPGPVWLVNGFFDQFRLHERRFLAACRDGRLVIVPRASHLVSLAQPERFTAVLGEILREVAAGRARPSVGPGE